MFAVLGDVQGPFCTLEDKSGCNIMRRYDDPFRNFMAVITISEFSQNLAGATTKYIYIYIYIYF